MNIPISDSGDRPAGDGKHCFYCRAPLGEHKDDCVCVLRSVVVQIETTVVLSCPRSWDWEQLEFYQQGNSSCMSNVFAMLARTCPCERTKFKVLREATQEDHENYKLIKLCEPNCDMEDEDEQG